MGYIHAPPFLLLGAAVHQPPKMDQYGRVDVGVVLLNFLWWMLRSKDVYLSIYISDIYLTMRKVNISSATTTTLFTIFEIRLKSHTTNEGQTTGTQLQ